MKERYIVLGIVVTGVLVFYSHSKSAIVTGVVTLVAILINLIDGEVAYRRKEEEERQMALEERRRRLVTIDRYSDKTVVGYQSTGTKVVYLRK